MSQTPIHCLAVRSWSTGECLYDSVRRFSRYVVLFVAVLQCGSVLPDAFPADAPIDNKEFHRWSTSAPEGIYRRGGDLVVVAVKEAIKDSSLWRRRLKAALMLSIQRQLTEAVIGGYIEAHKSPYPGLLGQLTEKRYRADLHAFVGALSGSGRIVNNDISGNTGRLVFALGEFSVEKATAGLPEPNWLELRRDVLNATLKSHDLDRLETIWSEQGLALDRLRLAADRVGAQRLVAFPWRQADPVSTRDGFLRLYFCDSRCAVPPDRHLELAQRIAPLDPAAASAHALSALITNQEPKMEQAFEVLTETLGQSAAGRELLALISRAASQTTESQGPAYDWIPRYVIATGGFFWIDATAPSEPGEALAVAIEAFEGGHSAESVLSAFLVAIEKTPRNASAWSHAASVLAYMQRDLEAIAFFHQALILDPGLLDARWNLSQLYSGNAAPGLAYAMASDISDRLSRGEKAVSTANLGAKVQRFLSSRSHPDT